MRAVPERVEGDRLYLVLEADQKEKLRTVLLNSKPTHYFFHLNAKNAVQ